MLTGILQGCAFCPRRNFNRPHGCVYRVQYIIIWWRRYRGFWLCDVASLVMYCIDTPQRTALPYSILNAHSWAAAASAPGTACLFQLPSTYKSCASPLPSPPAKLSNTPIIAGPLAFGLCGKDSGWKKNGVVRKEREGIRSRDRCLVISMFYKQEYFFYIWFAKKTCKNDELTVWQRWAVRK
jgi:hypothetical protein